LQYTESKIHHYNADSKTAGNRTRNLLIASLTQEQY